MARDFCLSMVGLLVLSVAGCTRDTPPPAAQPAPVVPDAQLQQAEEEVERARQAEAQTE